MVARGLRLRYSHKRPGRAPPQPAARRHPMSASAGPWTRPEGRARRPLASQASTSKSALSPARHRINSSCQRARPTPGTGKGVAGSAVTRQRVTDAVCRSPPAANGEADGAGPFGRELKAAGGRHGEPRDLGYDSAKAAMPQTLLETDEN